MATRRQLLIGASISVALVAAAACSSGTVDDAFWPPDAATTVASAGLSGQIIEVWVAPYPEGSNYVSYRTPPASDSTALYSGAKFDAFVATIGSPLPEPVDQPRRCQRGRPNYTVVVVLDSGQQQFYGPCTRPDRVEQAVKKLGLGF